MDLLYQKYGPESVRLLGGMLRLGKFMAIELAIHADVKPEIAEAFADECHESGLLNRLQKWPLSDHKGIHCEKSAWIYVFANSKRATVLSKIVEICNLLKVTSDSSDTEVGQEEDFSPLALLEMAVTVLSDNEPSTLESWEEQVDVARIRLAGAEADLKSLVAGSADTRTVEWFTARLAAAKATLDAATTPGHDPSFRAPS